MYTIGINDTHNSSVAIFKNDKLIFAAEEERFARCKQISGFPFYASKYALKKFNIKPDQIDIVAIATKTLSGMNVWNVASDFSIKDWYKLQTEFFYPKIYHNKKNIKLRDVFKSYKPSVKTHYSLKKIPLLSTTEMNKKNHDDIKNVRIDFTKNFFKITNQKIKFFDHHTCSAYYGYFNNSQNFKNKTAVVTCDSGGDNRSHSIIIFDKKKITEIKQNSLCLVGQIYDSVTLMIGMNPSRHQYKLMGLAPYASEYHRATTKNFLLDMFKVKGINFQKNKKMKDYFFYIKEKLKFERFDGIAAGAQSFVEITIIKWFKNIYNKFNVKNFVFVGGVANNVKANKSLLDQKFVNNLFVPAGPGDENLSLGAIYCAMVEKYGYSKTKKICNYKIENAYWGNSITLKDLEEFKNNKIIKKYYSFKYDYNFKLTAKILAKNKIVLLCMGKMEFGNRALGHRSIVCNPSDRNLVEQINIRFKKRDFWMPFAPSILQEKLSKYVKNPKKIKSNYMTLSFDSQNIAQKDLASAVHPYDKTLRPQSVSRLTDIRYHTLLKEFEKKTNIGALLNTSLNVHDKPIVCKPNDIINEFLINDNAIKNIDYIYVENTLFSLKKKYARDKIIKQNF